MNNKLFELLMELDIKYEEEISHYFKAPKDIREEIADNIANLLISDTKGIPIKINKVMVGLKKMIIDLEKREDYEKCDLFTKVEKKISERLEYIL